MKISSWYFSLLILLLPFFYLINLIIYFHGFLLTKKEIKEINNLQFNSKTKIKKVFFFIIDALRFDFLSNQRNTNNNHSFSNNKKQKNSTEFHFLHYLLENNSSQCLLFQFKADSPTTTSQRLNGIMTGSLPTFIEFGNNFHSTKVIEDSLILQWNLERKKIIMLGDDTWESLFPNQFYKSYPFDSFNTRDLDSVDFNILQNIWQFLSKENNNKEINEDMNWDILITHFLGVDHIGHTYNSYHPLMNQRLSLMNQVLKQFIQFLPDDCLLILMGDHGMTIEGEHGLKIFLLLLLFNL